MLDSISLLVPIYLFGSVIFYASLRLLKYGLWINMGCIGSTAFALYFFFDPLFPLVVLHILLPLALIDLILYGWLSEDADTAKAHKNLGSGYRPDPGPWNWGTSVGAFPSSVPREAARPNRWSIIL